MRNIKDFQARYDRWKNGERYWDIRGIDLPKYDTGDKNTVVTDDGSVFNVDPSAIGARNLEVTTPDVEVVGKKQYPYQSAFDPYAFTEGLQYALGNTVGRVMEPVSKIPGAMPILRTLTPSNWIGTLRTGIPMWNEQNPGFGTSYGDKQLNLLFDLGASPVTGKLMSMPFSYTKNLINPYISKLSQYKLRIPENKDAYYRVVNGIDAINDANTSGMITRPYVGDYMFPYFTKGQLYSRQNKAFDFGNRTFVIQSKPGQQFEFVTDGIHIIHPEKSIKIGDSATPVIKNEIGTAYNSAPAENFTYWSRGNGALSKYFWKQHEFSPFENKKIISRKSYGKPIAEGSESEVFENLSNPYTVLKEYSGGYRNNLGGMRDELIRRNSVPGAVPTKIEGITQDGWPVLSQPKVKAFPEGTKWRYSMAKDLLNLLRENGYVNGLHEGVPNNGVYKLVDLSPQNIGYLNKKVRLIDVPAYKLSNGK